MNYSESNRLVIMKRGLFLQFTCLCSVLLMQTSFAAGELSSDNLSLINDSQNQLSTHAVQPGLRPLDAPIHQITPQESSKQYLQILKQVQAAQKKTQDAAAPQVGAATAPADAKLATGNGSSAITTTNNKPGVSANDVAFIKMLHGMNPLSPDQIQMMHALQQKTKQATNYPDGAQRPSISTINVNLQPNATPPIISVSPGIVTALEFIDATGQPWPIQSFDIGNPADYNAKQTQAASKGQLGSNTLLLQGMTETPKPGNIAVMLQGDSTPVILALTASQTVVNYRVDLHIPGDGPNALQNSTNITSTSNDAVMSALNGVAPAGTKAVQLTGCDTCQAWTDHKHLYFRSHRALMSPSWVATSQSSDGTHAYKLPPVPVLLAFDNGKITKINVQY